MAVEAAIYSILTGDGTVSGLVSTRVYPLVAPQGGSLPFIVYQRISSPRDYSQSGPSLLTWPRFQITCVAATYDGARALGTAVRAALSDYAGTAGSVTIGMMFMDNEADSYEPNLLPNEPTGSAYMARQDFIIMHNEAAS